MQKDPVDLYVPVFSLPMRADPGTRTSSKKSSAVSCPFMPSFWSLLPKILIKFCKI